MPAVREGRVPLQAAHGRRSAVFVLEVPGVVKVEIDKVVEMPVLHSDQMLPPNTATVLRAVLLVSGPPVGQCVWRAFFRAGSTATC